LRGGVEEEARGRGSRGIREGQEVRRRGLREAAGYVL